MQTALETGKAEDERWHVRKDGSLFYASGVMQPMRTDSGGGFVKICRDQTDKLEAQTAIRDRRMLKRLVQTQEDERKRISRDLHDQLGQQLTALRLKLEALRANHALEPKLLNAIDETQELAQQIDSDVSFLTWELRPTALDNLGLRNALANFVVEWSKNYGIPAEFHTARLRKARLMPEIDINLYRIAQEALNNTLKHAKATKVDVLLEFGKSDVVLVIEDNGIGFNPEARSKPKDSGQGLGLIGMRERAALLGGTLQIESARHKGTTIIARVPAVYAGQKTNGKPKPAAKK
jgi:signal transduction histidine kinase